MTTKLTTGEKYKTLIRLITEHRGYTTPKAEIKGSTGMLELGWQIRPQKSHPWTLDINFTGRIGLQKGIYASAGVKKAF